jgi:D-aspartate ligase
MEGQAARGAAAEARDLSRPLHIEASALRPGRPPAMLLGGINLARALGLAGIPVIVATPEADPPAAASRYVIGRCELPPLASGEAVVAQLLRAADELVPALGTRVPLFYGNDDYLGLVQHFRSALARRYALLLNDARLARALHSKALFQALAERRGLPVPRRLDFERLAGFDAPVVVKPRMKTAWDDSAVHLKLFGGAGKARIFSSGRAAGGHTLVHRLADELTFQEYIPGDDRALWSFHGFADEDSELLACFVGRKIRTYPALTGDSSYLELAHDGELDALGRDIVSRLGLKGPFKIDFKRHQASGRWYLLEINARYNLWHYLGAMNGVNLTGVAYDYLVHGTRPGALAARTDYRWLCLPLDYRAFRAGDQGLLAWLASLLGARKVYDLFAWNDPRPLLAHWRTQMKSLPPRITRRLARWLSTAS